MMENKKRQPLTNSSPRPKNNRPAQSHDSPDPDAVPEHGHGRDGAAAARRRHCRDGHAQQHDHGDGDAGPRMCPPSSHMPTPIHPISFLTLLFHSLP